MPMVQAGIAALYAKTHGAAMFAEDKRVFSTFVHQQRIGRAQINAVMRRFKRFDDFRLWKNGTNPLGQLSMGFRPIASFRQHEVRGSRAIPFHGVWASGSRFAPVADVSLGRVGDLGTGLIPPKRVVWLSQGVRRFPDGPPRLFNVPLLRVGLSDGQAERHFSIEARVGKKHLARGIQSVEDLLVGRVAATMAETDQG